jgi:hypothetical protein
MAFLPAGLLALPAAYTNLVLNQAAAGDGGTRLVLVDDSKADDGRKFVIRDPRAFHGSALAAAAASLPVRVVKLKGPLSESDVRDFVAPALKALAAAAAAAASSTGGRPALLTKVYLKVAIARLREAEARGGDAGAAATATLQALAEAMAGAGLPATTMVVCAGKKVSVRAGDVAPGDAAAWLSQIRSGGKEMAPAPTPAPAPAPMPAAAGSAKVKGKLGGTGLAQLIALAEAAGAGGGAGGNKEEHEAAAALFARIMSPAPVPLPEAVTGAAGPGALAPGSWAVDAAPSSAPSSPSPVALLPVTSAKVRGVLTPAAARAAAIMLRSAPTSGFRKLMLVGFELPGAGTGAEELARILVGGGAGVTGGGPSPAIFFKRKGLGEETLALEGEGLVERVAAGLTKYALRAE